MSNYLVSEVSKEISASFLSFFVKVNIKAMSACYAPEALAFTVYTISLSLRLKDDSVTFA